MILIGDRKGKARGDTKGSAKKKSHMGFLIENIWKSLKKNKSITK